MSAAHRAAIAAVARTAIAGAAIAVVTAACGAGTATIARSRIPACTPRIVYMREGSGQPQMLTMLPNGRQTAFDNGAHILVMRANGAGVRDITPRLRGRTSIDPAWSPDGRWIAFSCEPAGTSNAALWLVRSNGLDLHLLVNAPGEEEHPSWSPDGNQIVFDSLRAQGPDDLYVVRADGSTKVSGTSLFVAQVASTRARTIIAQCFEHGIPHSPRTVAGVTAAAPPTPGKPGKLLLRRVHDTVVITWGPGQHAVAYQVSVTGSDGRRDLYVLRADRRRLVIKPVFPEVSQEVIVRAVGGLQPQPGPARVAKLSPGNDGRMGDSGGGPGQDLSPP